MAINVGGFFANLSLKSDKASFDESKKQLKGVEDQTKKTGIEFDTFTKNAIKGLVALGAAAMGSAYAVSNIQAKMELTATKAGMGYTEFNKFSSALKLVGVDSANVAGKMANVNSALNDFKVGKNSEALSGLAKNLALMGIDLKTFAGLTPTQQVELVAKKAEAAKGTEKEVGMRDLADEILGLGDVLMATQQKGSAYPNIAALLAAGAGATWSSSQSDVTKNSQAFNSLTLQMDQLWKTFGEKMGDGFRPMITDLANFLKDHKAEITKFFTDLAQLLNNLAILLGPTIEKFMNTTGQIVGALAAGQTAQEYEKKNPAQAKRLTDAIFKTPSLIGWGKGSYSEAEKAAFEIEAQGAKYSASSSEAARASAGLSPKDTNVTIGDINLSGVDFNQFVNYMQANPGANKYAVAAAALAATNNMAGTK